MKSRKSIKKKEDYEEVFRRMLEFYTMVPPSPLQLKRMRRSRYKKNKKSSIKIESG